jgi:hypothetical protein
MARVMRGQTAEDYGQEVTPYFIFLLEKVQG